MVEIKLQSIFVKVNVDVVQDDIATIKSEGSLEPSPKDPLKKIWNFQLELMNGENKKISFNNGSLTNFIKAWGKDMAKWVDKQIIVDIVKVQAFGEVKDSMVWKPVEK